MTGRPLYCTLSNVNDFVPERHMINAVIDRSGSSILDFDVLTRLEELIFNASTELDGYLRRYTDMPIDPTVTALTGVLVFTRGDPVVTGIGTSFITELSEGDEIRPDNNENMRVIVDTVDSDTKFTAKHAYYGRVDLTDTASIYEPNIPPEIRFLCRDHVAYILWNRRGVDTVNPMVDKEKNFQKIVDQIAKGQYRFEKSGDTVDEKKTITSFYSSSGNAISKVFTDDSMKYYTD